MRFVFAALLLPLALLWGTAIAGLVLAMALALVLSAITFGLGCRTAVALVDAIRRIRRTWPGARP